jgi:hypothetical protein
LQYRFYFGIDRKLLTALTLHRQAMLTGMTFPILQKSIHGVIHLSLLLVDGPESCVKPAGNWILSSRQITVLTVCIWVHHAAFKQPQNSHQNWNLTTGNLWKPAQLLGPNSTRGSNITQQIRS